MSSIAQAWVQGNLTAEPEVRTTTKGSTVVGMRVAVNHSMPAGETGERQEEVSFFPVVVFGRLGETVAKYLKKGDGVTVVGRLRQGRWEDADGNKRERVEIVARDVVFGQKARGSAPTAKAEAELEQAAAGETVGAAPF